MLSKEFQKSKDDSSNLIEFDFMGLSQPSFLEDITELHHPLLVAKKRLDKNFVHKSIQKRL